MDVNKDEIDVSFRDFCFLTCGIIHTTAPGMPTIKIGDIKNASFREKTSDRCHPRTLFYLFLKTVTGHGKKMGSFYKIYAIEFFL